MADRKRRRTILGYSEIACPHCGGGPLVLTESRFQRRVRDALNPRFEAKVAYREVCQACRMRYPISPTVRQPGPGARSTAMAGVAAPAPLFGGPVEEPAPAVVEEPVRPATPIRSSKPTQAAFFTDDDELDDD